jgi:copper chaperone CopZ
MTSSASPAQRYVVSGMTCDHCVLSVTEEVAEVAGVRDVSAELATGLLTVVGDGVSDEAVEAAVADAGYEVVA